MKPAPDPAPPRLAVRLLHHLAQPEYRDDLLGDLHEEFLTRHGQAGGQAQRWYWGQAAQSLPSLVRHRLRAAGARRLGMLLFAYVAALSAIALWDTSVSRQVAQTLAAQQTPLSLSAVRAVYCLLLACGALLAGALAAVLTFHSRRTLGANLAIGIGPIVGLTAIMLTANMLATGRYELFAYFVVRLLVVGPTLVLGGCLYAGLLRVRRS